MISSGTSSSRAQALAQGLKIYNTGKPCPSGHSGERYVSNRSCVVCTCGESAWQLTHHPESNRKAAQRYYAAHRECRLEQMKQRRSRPQPAALQSNLQG